MRNYEFTVICYADSEKLDAAKQLLEKLLGDAGAKITKLDDIGLRTLAYPIKKEEEGHYLYYELQMDPAQVAAVEAQLRLSTLILKYLFVRPE